MSLELKINLNERDTARAHSVLQVLFDKTSNPSGGLKVVGEALLKEQNRRFDTQSDPDGKPWAKLAPLTVETRGGATWPILRRSGQLKRSGAYQVSGATLRIGVNTIYAGVQHHGATIIPKAGSRLAIPVGASRGGRNSSRFVFAKSVTVPARPIVGFGDKDEKAARVAVEDWLTVPGAK